MSLEILKNSSLKPYNTFGIEVIARELVVINSVDDLFEILPKMRETPFAFIGGGSNMLFTKDFEGLIIINNIKGKEIISQSETNINISVYSGEIWHEMVLWALENGAFGLENLSLIPGTVGAAPMQNIGAYGEEIKNWCTSVEAINIETGISRIFSNEECQFGYRESIFKRDLKDQYFIYKVNFSLNTSRFHTLNCNYGAISEVLNHHNIIEPTAKDVSNAIIEIRSSKLPNPKDLGNAGSFFKNPVITVQEFEVLKQKYPSIPHYNDINGFKIPAGWLIEQAGFKGKVVGNTGSHKLQALVIVNYGKASGIEIYHYSQTIIDAVFTKFGIKLDREVNIF